MQRESLAGVGFDIGGRIASGHTALAQFVIHAQVQAGVAAAGIHQTHLRLGAVGAAATSHQQRGRQGQGKLAGDGPSKQIHGFFLAHLHQAAGLARPARMMPVPRQALMSRV